MKNFLIAALAALAMACGGGDDSPPAPVCSVVQNEAGNFHYVCDGVVEARCWTEADAPSTIQPGVQGDYFVVDGYICKE